MRRIEAAAAQLLVEIAGPEPVHIEMSAYGPKKYYDVHRSFTEQDARAHLAGRTTCGATLRHPGGMTRALCFDADTPDDWLFLLEAAWRLSEQRERPVLEESPVGRGGHLWIIFTELVRASWAHHHAVQLAPTLVAHIQERWPGESGHKVRLPGGLYVRPGVRTWCKLYDAQGRLLSDDGPGAARMLLDWQTPVEIVPAFPDARASGGTGELVALPNAQNEQRNTMPTQNAECKAGTDQRWQQKYSRFMWFQFTPASLAAWYNERTQVEEILPPEKNGMGLASWRGERTASVGLRDEGWVDFGASARRANGKQDGGDALELMMRVSQEAKPEVMRQIGRQLVREAREAMESAAWRGDQPPAWVQPFMTDAGWQRYHALRAEAALAATHRGVAGFYSLSAQNPERKTRMNEQQHHLSVQEMSDQDVTHCYVQEMLKLKILNQYGRHSERFLGYPNTLIMNRCRRELERRSLPIPPVNPAGKDEDQTERRRSASGVSARKDDNT